jgi:Tol biopolymer transport system component
MKNLGLITGRLLLFCLPQIVTLSGCVNQVTPPQRTPDAEVSIHTQAIDPSPVPTPTYLPTPEIASLQTKPIIPNMVQLTSEGCCANPTWSEDSKAVLYVDKPDDNQFAALYRIDILDGSIVRSSETLSLISPGGVFRAEPRGEQVLIERIEDSARWLLSTSGSRVFFSPESDLVAWEVGSDQISDLDRILRSIWISTPEGKNTRELIQSTGGRFQGWALGGDAVVVSGRLEEEGPSGLWRIDIESGDAFLLFESPRPQYVSVSPNGEWLVFTEAFNSDPSRDGLWSINLVTNEASPIDVFGAYRWRTGEDLVLIPLDLEASSQYLMQYNIPNNWLSPLTDPEIFSFEVANNDWTISPDGKYLVLRSARDGNLWLMELPDPPQSP